MKELSCLSALGFVSVFILVAVASCYMTCCNPEMAPKPKPQAAGYVSAVKCAKCGLAHDAKIER